MVKIKCVVFCMVVSIFASNSYSQEVKDCEFAGSFYPQDASLLDSMIDKWLLEGESFGDLEGDVLGIIAPHAGYIYSGKIAASGFNVIDKNKFDTVILLGPSHRYYFEGIAVYRQGAFDTPLGKLEVDHGLAARFKKLSFVNLEPGFFQKEHCLEVQLPFIKKVLPDCKIVPVIFGKLNFGQMKELAQYFSYLTKEKRILFVVSTDLSHYHPYEQAVRIDSETIEHIENLDAAWFWDSLKAGEQKACGILPLITFILYVKKEGGQIEKITYANSGDSGPDKSKVVGYLSAVAYRINSHNDQEDTMNLSREEKDRLITIARKTLEEYLKSGKYPKISVNSERLKENRAVFVTLKKDNQLRGCIGRIVADMPLYESVSKVAVDSALHDPRFAPVQYDELAGISIEISVMTPFETVGALEEIEVGKHGLIIQKGFHSGLLLPQVPTEYGWDRKTFLEHLCQKAGLPVNAYMDKDAKIYKFSADVFSEKESD
ncbi:MAG: AmmeMemoRadiSam system protein B [Candidatus Omnitrophota bacterium]